MLDDLRDDLVTTCLIAGLWLAVKVLEWLLPDWARDGVGPSGT